MRRIAHLARCGALVTTFAFTACGDRVVGPEPPGATRWSGTVQDFALGSGNFELELESRSGTRRGAWVARFGGGTVIQGTLTERPQPGSNQWRSVAVECGPATTGTGTLRETQVEVRGTYFAAQCGQFDTGSFILTPALR